jgi:2-haloacid dehalogenase
MDWESGILRALAPLLRAHGLSASPAALLRNYARLEAQLERAPYRSYREVLHLTQAGLLTHLQQHAQTSHANAAPSTAPGEFTQRNALALSLPYWQPFPDTIPALMALSRRFQLLLLSNIDDDLLASTIRRLGVPFSATITAAQVHSYKPSPSHFQEAIRRLGLQPERWVHVAQSVYHDHVPAKRLGLRTVWVCRTSHVPGTGVALPALAQPDLVVPNLMALAEIALEQMAWQE